MSFDVTLKSEIIESSRSGAINTAPALTNSTVEVSNMAKPTLAKTNLSRKYECLVSGCDDLAYRRSYCAFHYGRLRTGVPLERPKFQRGEHLRDRNHQIILLRKQGKTCAEIAEQFNVSHQRVQQILKKSQIQKPNWAAQNKSLINRVWRRYLLGKGTSGLASIFHLNPGTVSKILGIKRRQLSPEHLEVANKTREFNMFRLNVDHHANADVCWEWHGRRNIVTGYGIAKYKKKWIGAHVASWQFHNGRETSLHILHSCDNRPCVNPQHLREGTAADNMADRDRRGRAGWQKDYDGWLSKLRNGKRNRSDRSGRKFSDDEINEIRRRYLTDAESSRSIAASIPHAHHSEISRIARYDTYIFMLNGDRFPVHPVSERVHALFGRKRK